MLWQHNAPTKATKHKPKAFKWSTRGRAALKASVAGQHGIYAQDAQIEEQVSQDREDGAPRLTAETTLYDDADTPIISGTETSHMPNDITAKDYIDRSMDAVRAQNDARFADMLSEIRLMRADIDSQFAKVASRLDILSSETASTRQVVIDAKEAANRAQSAANAAEAVARSAADVARTQNWNILMAAIAVVAVILALAGLWMTAMQTVGSLIR